MYGSTCTRCSLKGTAFRELDNKIKYPNLQIYYFMFYQGITNGCTSDDVPPDGSPSVLLGIWRCSTGQPCTCNLLICV